MLIAIDGPAGAGKSTVASLLASKLSYVHLDSGALYRSLALLASKKKLSPYETSIYLQKHPSLFRFCYQNCKQQIFLEGELIQEQIRSQKITTLITSFANCPECRQWVNDLMRAIATKISLVIDGRDIGTIVFPHADFKFYLDACVEVRAARRAAEKNINTTELAYQKLRTNIIARDKQDQLRKIAPLIKAKDAIYIDSSSISRAQVVAKMLQFIS